jgi:hypothetical protein
MIEALREKNNEEFPFSKGDVVLVLEGIGDPEFEGEGEKAGIVHEIDSNGTVFINYGGMITPLHEQDQIRLAPEDIHEVLRLQLNQNEEDMQKSMLEATRGLCEPLEEYHETNTFFKWIKHSIKSRFGENKKYRKCYNRPKC